MSSEQEELDQLRLDVDRLSDELASLKRAISDARGQVKLSMKDQICCPYCDGRRIAKFKSIPDQDHGTTHDLGLKIEKRPWYRTDLHEPFRAYVCATCGIVELRLEDTSKLAESSETFEILTSAEPERGPYR